MGNTSKKQPTTLISSTHISESESFSTFGFVFNLNTLEVESGKVHSLSDFERALEERLAPICGVPSTGYIAVCGGGTADWAKQDEDPDFLNRLSSLERRFKRLAKTSVSKRVDSPDTASKPFISD